MRERETVIQTMFSRENKKVREREIDYSRKREREIENNIN